MFEGNAMERINNHIKSKNSRICVVLNIDSDIPKMDSDEVTYEYLSAYLQVIAGIVPAVKIISKEKDRPLYWNIVEVAKSLGLLVICEIKEEEIGYIMDIGVKRIIEKIDAVIIETNLGDKLEVVEQFIKLLKLEGKAAFISPMGQQENKKTKWWRRIFKEKKITTKELFLKLYNKFGFCYDENAKLTYIVAGLVITKLENKELLNPYIFAICDYEEKIDDIVDDIVNIADGEGLGLLITSNLNINIEQGQAWEENVKLELIRENEIINNAINQFYGIED